MAGLPSPSPIFLRPYRRPPVDLINSTYYVFFFKKVFLSKLLPENMSKIRLIHTMCE